MLNCVEKSDNAVNLGIYMVVSNVDSQNRAQNLDGLFDSVYIEFQRK